MQMSIEIKNVTKKFGKTVAVDAITAKIDEEKIYGILGRNGAGKSTLLNIISNRIIATDGEVLVDGEEAVENNSAQEKVFLMSEVDMYPQSMNTAEILKWTSKFYPDTDIEKGKEIAKRFTLDIKKGIGQLSTGYRTIAKFVAAIAPNAKYTFLDEPVLGLDANHRELLYKIIVEEYAENPRMIAVATHIIEEVAGLLEEVIIIEKGKVIETDSVENLLSRGYGVTGKAELVDGFCANKNVIGTESIGSLKIAYILGHDNISEIPDGLEISPLNLQKLFIVLTGGEEEVK
jgi:ABC-2 type transport system ATP-binding protein